MFWTYCFNNRPVCLEKSKMYKLVSFVKGPVSWYSEGNKRRLSLVEYNSPLVTRVVITEPPEKEKKLL